MNGIRPDHRTISLFIKENRKGFKNVMRIFTCLLKGWGLIDGELVVIDGTKIQAQNSKKNYITPNGITKKIECFDEKIEHYLQDLEEIIREDSLTQEDVLSIKAKIEKYKTKKENLNVLKEKMVEKKRFN